MSEQLAWAAGFFDAEGCFSSTTSFMATVSQVDPSPLQRFDRTVGVGSVTGPRKNSGFGTQPIWTYQAYGSRGAGIVLALLAPYLSTPKREQAMRALGSETSMPPVEKLPARGRVTLAWAAGFLEGDGSFSYSPSNNYCCVSFGQVEPAPLDRFLSAVGIGKVYGPYPRPLRMGLRTQRDMYIYRAHGFEKVQAIAAMLWPWLGPPKREQARRVLEDARAHGHFTRCKRGHPKEPRRRACPECTREHWRMYREGTLFEPSIPYLVRA